MRPSWEETLSIALSKPDREIADEFAVYGIGSGALTCPGVFGISSG